MIYMDNAATTAVRKEVAEAMLPYLLGDYGNPSGVYRLSEKAKNVVEESRDIIADIINADRNEIFFTSGGTEGDNCSSLTIPCSSTGANVTSIP